MSDFELTKLAVPGALRIESDCFQDQRGSFVSPLRESAPHSINLNYRNVYLSYNTARYTLRGFHYQKPPKGENKIVTAISGVALHVLVSLSDSGEISVAQNLLDKPNVSTFVPHNAASAFLTLEPQTTIQYLSDTAYDSQMSSGYLWNDPSIGFDWGVTSSQITISTRDTQFKLI